MLPNPDAHGSDLTIRAWRAAKLLFEDQAQVALIGETARLSDLGQRQVRLTEQPLRVFDPLMQDELVRACVHDLSKQPSKMIRTEANLVCQHLQRQFLAEMLLNKLQNLLDLVIGQSSWGWRNTPHLSAAGGTLTDKMGGEKLGCRLDIQVPRPNGLF